MNQIMSIFAMGAVSMGMLAVEHRTPAAHAVRTVAAAPAKAAAKAPVPQPRSL